jgi:hypothetical protein
MPATKKLLYLKGEKWVTIPGKRTHLKEKYAISSFGRLVKYLHEIKDGSLLKGSRQQGYPIWRYRLDGVHCHQLFHKLVAKYFLPRPGKNQSFILHLDYNKANNHYKNLKWASQEELTKHSFNNPSVKKAKKKRLENIGTAYNTKLTATKVIQVKNLLKKGKTLKEIAAKYGVSDMQIYRIKTGENWGYIK